MKFISKLKKRTRFSRKKCDYTVMVGAGSQSEERQSESLNKASWSDITLSDARSANVRDEIRTSDQSGVM